MGTPLPNRTTPLPAWMPVSLKEARHQVRLDESERSFDNELLRLLGTAQETVEADTDRIAQAGTFEWTLDGLPELMCPLRLPYRNTTDVTTVAYTDTAGDPQTFTDFTFAGNRVYPQLFTNNVVWPETQFGYAETVVITFDAGYASAADVPDNFKSAMLAMLQNLWDNCDSSGSPSFGRVHTALTNRQLATYL